MKRELEADLRQIRKLLSLVLGSDDYQSIERLGGMTNHTYKVSLENGDAYVLRIPGAGTEDLIDRANERISAKLACRLGIDAEVLLFSDCGHKVTKFIAGAQTLSPASFSDPELLKKAAQTLRTLHICGEDTGVAFDVFDMVQGYERIISSNHVPLFSGYGEIKRELGQIRKTLSACSVPAVPCHNDPWWENWVLSETGKLYLIDWEYAGMNDAMWDLADISVETGFTQSQDANLLQLYFGRSPAYDERLRFFANKLYLYFLWSLWGKARVPFDGESMEQYGQERFDRLKNNLQLYRKQFPDGVG